MHRSVIAEYYIKKLVEEKGLQNKISAISRGIQGSAGFAPTRGKHMRDYPNVYEKNIFSLGVLGLDILEHVSTPIQKSDIEQATCIIAMDQNVLTGVPRACLYDQFPNNRHTMKLFMELCGIKASIPDCSETGGFLKYTIVNFFICMVIHVRFRYILRSIGVH